MLESGNGRRVGHDSGAWIVIEKATKVVVLVPGWVVKRVVKNLGKKIN